MPKNDFSPLPRRSLFRSVGAPPQPFAVSKRKVERVEAVGKLVEDSAMVVPDTPARPKPMPQVPLVDEFTPDVVKVPGSYRFDQDVVEWFKGAGKGYQTRMNAVLRKYMEDSR